MNPEKIRSWNTQQLKYQLSQLRLEKIRAEKEAIQLGIDTDTIGNLINLGIRIGRISNELEHRPRDN
jgi:hypothetical protein